MNAELEGMPAPLNRVRALFKVEPHTRYMERVPDLGEPLAYPDLSIGFVTKVTHGTDKDGELWTLTVEEIEP